MKFYLKMISSEDTKKYQNLMEMMILNKNNEMDLDQIMKEFLEIQTSLKHQDNIIIQFLEFLLKSTKSQTLKEMAKSGLRL
ncbi:hypothetical protein DFH28DRAFT_404796 [Melampsora americana]|nr:hypothetical protein DFH28DRAFT_404796 [Melampsora americana]